MTTTAQPLGGDNRPTPMPASRAPRSTRSRLYPGRITAISLLLGIAIAVLWSARLVDDDIGVNTANGLLGGDAESASLSGTLAGLAFALVTGLAGTFTACNVAVFSAIAPNLQDDATASGRLRRALRPLGWLSVGAIVVAGVYGAIGALIGSHIPQLSTGTVGSHQLPVRLLQSVIVFGLIGLVMLYLGLAALRASPSAVDRLSEGWPPAGHVVTGMLIGGFLIGRPWPLFHKMFAHAASTDNAAYGAATFILVALGNMLLMGLLFLLLSLTRFPSWLRHRPSRAATATAMAWLVGGSFTLVYWVVRLPAVFGIGWFPTMPWN
jgi:hypothetical protein